MTVAVETGTWQLDRAASTVALRHGNAWGLVTMNGTFDAVSGQGEVRPDGSAVGTVTLDVTSLRVKLVKRIENIKHLLSADFFDAGNHPEIIFAAHRAELRADETVQVIGQLTIRGVSRPLSLTARLVDAGADALTLATEFSVDRAQFGMDWNLLGMIRGLATVTATLRFVRAAA